MSWKRSVDYLADIGSFTQVELGGTLLRGLARPPLGPGLQLQYRDRRAARWRGGSLKPSDITSHLSTWRNELFIFHSMAQKRVFFVRGFSCMRQ